MKKKSHKGIWIFVGITLFIIIGIIFYIVIGINHPILNQNECGTINGVYKPCPSNQECVLVSGFFKCELIGKTKYYLIQNPVCLEKTLQEAQQIGGRIFTSLIECKTCLINPNCNNQQPLPFCGDTICQYSRSEDKYSCPIDCGLPLPICGNGKCEVFHYSPNLPPYSSDIIYEFEVCPQDCGGGTQTPPAQQNNAELVYSLTQKQRPLVGGLQIEMKRNSGIAYCSLGAIVNYNGRNYILTASHCVATSQISASPSQSDIGLPVKQGDEQVGLVYKVADYSGGVDASLISINNGINSQQKDYLGNLIEGFGTAKIGLKVYKIGRTTGLTYGTIIAVNSYVTDAQGNKFNVFDIKGDNGEFAESGDSGSAIVTVASPHKIIGILSACDSSGCLSNMPEDIKNKLGL